MDRGRRWSGTAGIGAHEQRQVSPGWEVEGVEVRRRLPGKRDPKSDNIVRPFERDKGATPGADGRDAPVDDHQPRHIGIAGR